MAQSPVIGWSVWETIAYPSSLIEDLEQIHAKIHAKAHKKHMQPRIRVTEEEILALTELAAQDPEIAAFASPEGADGSCGYATDLFLDIAEQLLPGAEIDEAHFGPARKITASDRYLYNEAPHPWYLSGCKWPGHVVAIVGGWLIDWTARQFDPNAPFPLIFQMGAPHPRCT